MVPSSEKWRDYFYQKIKKESFFSPQLEECIANFVTDSWMKEETFQKACNISILELEMLYADAFQFYQKNLFSESCELFRLLVLIDPFVEKYWLGLGATLQMDGRYEEALKSYGVVACLDETSPYPYYYSAECLEKLNRSEESKDALKKAYAYASSSPKYGDLLQSLRKEI